jgi:NitT/TauT family transport system substrate-binding protein
MKKALIALCLALAVCTLAIAGGKSDSGSAPAAGTASAAPEKVEFLLNWKITADHSPYYIAVEKGWYKDAGLDVNIIVGQGSGYSVQFIDSGKADVAISDAAVPVTMRQDGAKIKIIGVIYDKILNCSWYRKSSGINTPKDLIGKTAAIPPTDGHKVMWPAFCKLVGIPADSVKWINIDAAAKVPSLANRNCDVTFELFISEPFFKTALGDDLGYFLWNDYGYDSYAHSYIASDDVIAKRPQMLKKFLDVNYKAWQYALNNPKEAIEILAKYHPININEYIESFEVLKEAFRTDRYKNVGIGYIDPARMKVTYDLVNEYQKPLSFPVTDIYDSSFLPNPMYKYNWQ